jgi:hypothetical protein
VIIPDEYQARVDAAHLELLPKGEPRHGLATMSAFSVDLFKPLKLWIPARLEESVTICRIWVGDDQRTVYSGPTPAWAFQHAALGIPSLMPGEQIAVEIQLPIRKQGVTKVPELAMGFVGRSRPAPKGERPRHPSDPSRVVVKKLSEGHVESCPECGAKSLQLVETCSAYRSLRRATSNRIVASDLDYDDGAGDYRLSCKACSFTGPFELPDGVELDFE